MALVRPYTVYDQVLLPTDGSPGAEAAIEHGIHVASRDDAVVHSVHVAEMTDVGDVTTGIPEDEPDEAVRQLLESVRDAATEAGLETEEAILEGRPHEEITRYVDRNDIDLVVLGTHGKTGISRVLLGSTAEKVVRHSSAPVLTVSPDEG